MIGAASTREITESRSATKKAKGSDFRIKFKFLNTKINISFYFVALITILLNFDKSRVFLIAFISIILHEIGHIVAMVLQSQKIREIKFGAFCIDIVNSSKNTIFTMLSGSLSNFIFAIIFLIFYNFSREAFFKFAALQGMYVGVFNLMPILDLDGGQIIFYFLSRKFKYETAERALTLISFAFLTPIAVLGFLILLESKNNFSLLLLACYLMFCLVFKKEVM